MKTYRFLAVLVVATFTGILLAQGGKPDFSGSWSLDEQSSQLASGRGGRGVPEAMTVHQTDDSLIVGHSYENRNGETVDTRNVYLLNGTPTENEARRGKSVSTALWSEDGNMLNIRTEMEFSRGGRSMTFTVDAKWSLEDGKLVVQTAMTTPRGERTSRAVYVREN